MRLYILAMESEASSIIKDAEKIQSKPFELYKSKNNKNLICISGIGKVNASGALSYVLNKYDISEIINIGFAGASGNFELGDKVLIKEARYHDFDLTNFGYKKGQVPNLPAVFKSTLEIKNNKHFKKGYLYTGDYFTTKLITNDFLSDMEGASLYHIAYIYEAPITAIKVVSDIINEKQQQSDYDNFEKEGSKYVLDIYRYLEGR